MVQFPTPGGYVSGCISLSLCLCLYLMNGLLLYFLMRVEPSERKMQVNFGKDPDHILQTKKKKSKFSKVPFQCIFHDFGFTVHITLSNEQIFI